MKRRGVLAVVFVVLAVTLGALYHYDQDHQRFVDNIRATHYAYTLSGSENPGLCTAYVAYSSDKFTVKEEGSMLYISIKTASGEKNFDSALNEGLSFSPDGKSIAYIDQNHQLMIADDQGAYLVSRFGAKPYHSQDSHPVFSQDGSKVAFIRDGNMYIVNTDGSQLALMTGRYPGKEDFSLSNDSTPLLGSGSPFPIIALEADIGNSKSAIYVLVADQDATYGVDVSKLIQVDSGEGLQLLSWNDFNEGSFVTYQKGDDVLAFNIDKGVGQVVDCAAPTS